MQQRFNLRRFASLVKVNAKEGLAQAMSQTQAKKRGKRPAIFYGLLLAACFGLTMWIFSGTGYELASALLPLGMEPLLVSLVLMLGLIGVCLSGVTLLPSVLYFGGDTEIYLAMPLRPREILASKFVSLVIQQYLMVLLIPLPLAIGHLAADFRASSLFGWLFSLLLLPVFPIVLISLLLALLMMVAPMFRDKNRMALLSGLASIVFAVGLAFLFQGENSGDVLLRTVLRNESLFETAAKVFPPLQGAQWMICGTGGADFLKGLGVVVGSSVLVVVLYVLLMERHYINSLQGLKNTRGKRHRLNEHARQQAVAKGSSLFATLFQREWKMLFRTPVYFLNNVITSLLIPAIAIAFGIFGAMKAGLPSLWELQQAIQATMENVVVADPWFGLALGLTIGGVLNFFMSGMNGVAATAYSRDARHLGVLSAMPLSAVTLALAKLSVAMLLSSPMTILLAVAFCLFVGVYPTLLSGYLLGSVLSLYLANLLDLLVDYHRPKLNWTDENQAVEGNLNTFFAVLIGYALCGLVVLGGVFLPVEYTVYVYLVTAFCLLLAVALTLLLFRRAQRWLQRLAE